MTSPRPAACCGKCPPIVGGGYDCTCAGNPRCRVTLDQAERVVRDVGFGSVSMIQRRLRVGYAQAAAILDRLEDRGVVGPQPEGTQARAAIPQGDPVTTAEPQNGPQESRETDPSPLATPEGVNGPQVADMTMRDAAREAVKAWRLNHYRTVAADVLRDAAAECHNGAGDPEQEFYDRGVAQWLRTRADRIEAGQ